jgi:hypothetical protein
LEPGDSATQQSSPFFADQGLGAATAWAATRRAARNTATAIVLALRDLTFGFIVVLSFLSWLVEQYLNVTLWHHPQPIDE